MNRIAQCGAVAVALILGLAAGARSQTSFCGTASPLLEVASFSQVNFRGIPFVFNRSALQVCANGQLVATSASVPVGGTPPYLAASQRVLRGQASSAAMFSLRQALARARVGFLVDCRMVWPIPTGGEVRRVTWHGWRVNSFTASTYDSSSPDCAGAFDVVMAAMGTQADVETNPARQVFELIGQ